VLGVLPEYTPCLRISCYYIAILAYGRNTILLSQALVP